MLPLVLPGIADGFVGSFTWSCRVEASRCENCDAGRRLGEDLTMCEEGDGVPS